MSMFETQSAKEIRDRKERLWGKPKAQVIQLENHVEAAVQEEPSPVPQPLPKPVVIPIREVRNDEAEQREQRLLLMEEELQRLLGLVKAEIQSVGDEIAARPHVDQIIRATAAYYEVAAEDLRSHRRVLDLITPRHVAIHLCRELTLLSFSQLGRKFGNRDHSTIFNGDQKIRLRRQTDAELNRQVEELANIIRSEVGARVTAQKPAEQRTGD